VKACNQLIELSFCVVCALAPSALWTLNADSLASSPRETALHRVAGRESILGSVSAKTGSSLTVSGKTIATTVGSAFIRDGRAVELSDIQVGDKVKVVASKGPDDTWRADSVEVVTIHPDRRRPG
jgi:hypothetical protein